jgi:hypothetical protein
MACTQAKIYNSSLVQDGNNSEPLLPTAQNTLSCRSCLLSYLKFGVFGGILGFVVRIVSLKARSLVATSDYSIFYSILSQADLAIHALIWMIFFSIMFVCRTEKRRRLLTSSVVSLMIGVIAGSFLAWNFVDMTLGFPLSLTSRLLSFNLMMLQCWLLYRCDDVCDQDQEVVEKPQPAEEDILVIV